MGAPSSTVHRLHGDGVEPPFPRLPGACVIPCLFLLSSLELPRGGWRPAQGLHVLASLAIVCGKGGLKLLGSSGPNIQPKVHLVPPDSMDSLRKGKHEQAGKSLWRSWRRALEGEEKGGAGGPLNWSTEIGSPFGRNFC